MQQWMAGQRMIAPAYGASSAKGEGVRGSTVEVAINQTAGVIVIVHRQDRDARDETADFLRERRLAAARRPRQANLPHTSMLVATHKG